MTTIVYDHKSKKIACDSRLNADGVILCDSAEKWKTHQDGSIWFFTGSPADDEKLMELKHDDKPDVKPNCSAIYVKDCDVYLVTFDGDYCSHTKLDYNYALGSGWKFALSSLDFGVGVKEAIDYAAKRDCYTGGNVNVFDVVTCKFV